MVWPSWRGWLGSDEIVVVRQSRQVPAGSRKVGSVVAACGEAERGWAVRVPPDLSGNGVAGQSLAGNIFWRHGMAKPRINWQAAHFRTEELRKKLRREVTPRDVLRDARSTSSPYNKFFCWDDTKAAEAHRVNQARQLLQHLKLIYTDDEGNEVPVRRYVRVMLSTPADKELRSGYVPRQKVLKTDYLRIQVVESARQLLESFKSRFRMFREIEEVYPLIDQAIGILAKRVLRKRRSKAE